MSRDISRGLVVLNQKDKNHQVSLLSESVTILICGGSFTKREKTFEGVEELMVREQFTNSCPRDVSIASLRDLAASGISSRFLHAMVVATDAGEYLVAIIKKLSTETTLAR